MPPIGCASRAVLLAVAGVVVVAAAPVPQGTIRSVYVSAVDARGVLVADLTMADVVVRENRQVREVTALAPAIERMHVAVLVEDGGDGLLRGAVARLATALADRASLSISILNPQPFRLTDYTADMGVLRAAISRIVRRGAVEGDPLQLIEAVSWAAVDLRKREFSRPVIVALTTSGEPGRSEIAEDIVEDLRVSGASLHVVYAGGLQMGRVLMDGPTRSGGSTHVANSTTAFSDAMASIARMLVNQYRLTYVLPDGVRPRSELQVTTSRADVRIVAPTRIPDR